MYDPLKHGLECIPYFTVVRRNNTVNNKIPKRQFIPQFAGTCVRFFLISLIPYLVRIWLFTILSYSIPKEITMLQEKCAS